MKQLIRCRLPEVELAVQDVGTGEPWVFVHGFPLDHTMWRFQVAELSRRVRCVVPDLRGFGQSSRTDTPLSMQLLADDLAALLDNLRITEPVTVCGLSMGGCVALQFALRHRSRLRRLVLCDCRAANDSAAIQETRRQLAARVLSEGNAFLVESFPQRLFCPETFTNQPEVVEQLKGVIARTAPESIAAGSFCLADRPDVTSRLGELDVPTLVIVGTHDVISPPSEMHGISQLIPEATFVEIAEAGHMAPLENPEAVNAALEHFLVAT